ncbi:MAG TPA: FUSC family protein [Burkholderiales bacterium]|nr:FUSC family protein [Burkholderiales bacterium]
MTRLSAAQWRYCAKVGIATALGYALTQGGQNEYAIYSAFTAALVVGTSVGEDLATSASRVKGTVVGMITGIVVAALVGPSILTIGASAALTALLALLLGWGVPVARIGVTVCVITLAVHSVDAVHYDLYRAVNTLIGIAAGLAVTLFIWPVRSRVELERTMQQLLSVSRAVLDAVARGEQDLRPLLGKLHDHIAAVVKAGRDAHREWQAGHPVDVEEARVIDVIRLGVDVLSAALGSPSADALQALGRRADELSK